LRGNTGGTFSHCIDCCHGVIAVVP
jgi:hypothetical protein